MGVVAVPAQVWRRTVLVPRPGLRRVLTVVVQLLPLALPLPAPGEAVVPVL